MVIQLPTLGHPFPEDTCGSWLEVRVCTDLAFCGWDGMSDRQDRDEDIALATTRGFARAEDLATDGYRNAAE